MEERIEFSGRVDSEDLTRVFEFHGRFQRWAMLALFIGLSSVSVFALILSITDFARGIYMVGVMLLPFGLVLFLFLSMRVRIKKMIVEAASLSEMTNYAFTSDSIEMRLKTAR